MGYTVDSIFNEKIRMIQSRGGYRFALDAILLAHFLKVESHEDVLEVGAGNGVITVLLSHLRRFRSLVAVEIQSELAELCRENFKRNRLYHAKVLEADIKQLNSSQQLNSFDLIFSNPPYRKLGTGKLNPSLQKAMARHEIKMDLEDLFRAASAFLKPEGRLSVILPVFRENDFIRRMIQYKMVYQEHRYVHSFAGEPSAFFLATVSHTPGTCIDHPPLVIYDSRGRYTEEAANLLGCGG